MAQDKPEQKTEQQPDQKPDAETLYRQGRDARLGGKMDDAIKTLGEAAKIEPDNADVQVELGLAYAATKRFGEAKNAFSSALKIAPAYDDAQLGLARTQFWNGETEAAGATLAPLLKKSADNAEAKELSDQIAAARKEASAPKPPVAGVEEFPAPTPTPAPAQVKKAPAPKTPAKPVAAEPEKKPARPANVAASLNAEALALRRRGKFPEAEGVYKKLLAQYPRDVDVLVNLGLVQAFQGEKRFDDARATFERALAIDPNSIDAKLGVVRVDLYTNQLDKADAAVNEVLEKKPDYTDALSLRARIRLARMDLRGAEDDFAGLVQRDPKDSDALVGLGDSVREQYRDTEAQAIFEKAHAMTPDSQDISKRLELPVRPRWRIDLDGNYSSLTDHFHAWKEGAVHIGYIWDERTTVTLGAETDQRFGKVDTLIDGRIDNRWSRVFSTYLHIGGTPDASFRPTALLDTGASVEIWKGYRFLGATQATLDLGIAHYRRSGEVKSASPGIVQYFADGRFWLTAKMIGTLATNGDQLLGYSVRGDVKVTDKLTAFLGYADAPDNSDGRTFPSKAVFGGLSYDFSERFSIRASAAHEARTNSYTRTTYSLGLTAKY